MWVVLGAVFVASLLGSLHCVGMCGPFAILASSPGGQKTAWIPAAAYSLGRLFTYAIVGLIFGAVGLALNAGTSMVGWQQTATLAAGIIMVLVGLIALARQFGLQIHTPVFFLPLQQLLKRGFSYAKSLPPAQRAFVIGASTSLMPCGWLYTFAIAAAGTASPIWGTALMASFWAGTVPIMVMFVLGANRVGKAIQNQVPAILASLVILIGVFTIAFRSPIAVSGQPIVVQEPSKLVESIQAVDHSKLPCCSSTGRDEP